MGSHRTRSIGAWVTAALGCGLLASSCLIAPEEVSGPCTTDVDCPDDGVPCTKEVCGANGFCARTPQDLPPGDTGCDDDSPCTKATCSSGKCAQVPQDLALGDKGCDDDNPCTDEVCESGACAHKTASAPPNDGNECTSDACVGGVAEHTPLGNGTPCGLGLMCTDGKCNCQTADECGTSTECLKFACTDNACASTSLEQGTLVDGKDPGDCLKRVCDGANMVVTVPDDTDPPPNVPGDCKKKACDADGTVLDVEDATDLPADDANPCTKEGCSSGTPIDHEPLADGTSCGNPASCDPAAGGGYESTPHDACAAGACGGQAHVPCGLYKCNGTACKVACADSNDCISGTYCDAGTNTCKLVADTGNPCSANAQCSSNFCVDGLCCNSACTGFCERCNDAGSLGLCIPTQSGQDPDNECAGADACNGQGACGKQPGSACALDVDCLTGICEDATCCDVTCSGACKRCDLPAFNGTCSPVDASGQVMGCTGNQACDGTGSCKSSNGNTCASNTDCLSGFCQDNYCCNSSCSGTCNRCDLPGTVGICANVALGGQVAGCNGTLACNGMNSCKKLNGQTCNNTGDCVSGLCPSEGGAQKYCCDAACGETCKSCAGTKTIGQLNGVCDWIKDKTDPDAECAGAGCNSGNGSGCCVFSGGMSSCMN